MSTWLVWAVMVGSCTTCSLVTASSTSPAPPRTWHTHTPVSLWLTAARLRIIQISCQTETEIILK